MQSSVSARILCVDEDHKVLALRKTLLSIAGYDVLTAISADSALAILRESAVDLVITEYLPVNDSTQSFLAAIKRQNPGTPVLLYSAASDYPDGAEHADLLLAKGMHPDDFLAQVALLITKRRFAGQQ